MTRANVETVRGAWAAYLEQGIAGVVAAYTEDCVVEDFPELPDAAGYSGRAGVRERDEHFRETWGDLAFEPVEFIDAGRGVVIAVVAVSARGEGSGAPIDGQAAFVYEFRDGAIVRDRAFTSKSQAVEAIGGDAS